MEGFIMAAEDQSLFTRNYQAKTIKNGADPKCWFREKLEESIDHCQYLEWGNFLLVKAHWIPNLGVSYSKPLGGSKVDLAFHDFKVGKMNTRNSWELW